MFFHEITACVKINNACNKYNLVGKGKKEERGMIYIRMGVGLYAFEETAESIINSSKLLLCKILCLEMILVWWEPPSSYRAAATQRKNML